jgi:cell wall-associated NlpC family hydrolase
MDDIKIPIADLTGIPFLDRGRDYRVGLDCWGLVMEVYRRLGVKLPNYLINCEDVDAINDTYQKEKLLWIPTDKPEFPDIIALRFNESKMNHVAVYIGNGEFLHARSRSNSSIESLNHVYWKRAVEGFYKWGGFINDNR